MNPLVVCESIEFDGRSITNVASQTKIPQSSLQRFCSGERGMQLDSFRSVCDHLELSLVRFVDLGEYCRKHWEEYRDEIVHEAYGKFKESEWEAFADEAWKERKENIWEDDQREIISEYAKENDIIPLDSDEIENLRDLAYEDWEQNLDEESWRDDRFSDWSEAYDELHYSDWEEPAYEDFVSSTRVRLSKIDWVVLRETENE